MEKLETDGLEYVLTKDRKIKDFVGKKVIVWVGSEVRNNFDTCISICGTLESHPQLVDNYRVVVDNETYTYFTVKEMVAIFVPPKNTEIRAEALIKLDIK